MGSTHVTLTSRRVLVLGGFNSSNTAGALVGIRRFSAKMGRKKWETVGNYGKLWEIMGNYGKLWEND